MKVSFYEVLIAINFRISGARKINLIQLCYSQMPRRRKDMISGSVTVSSVGRGYSQLHHRSIVTKEKPQQRNGNSSCT